MESNTQSAICKRTILKIGDGASITTQDRVVIEEPLEIRIRHFFRNKWQTKPLVLTMRTPGNDPALALGFLFTEGLIAQITTIASIEVFALNVLIVNFIDTFKLNLGTTDRNFYATSSCGVCGKASIEKLEKISCFFPQRNLPSVAVDVFIKLPTALRNIQSIFEQTGGIHAAGLFTAEGKLIELAEDVGRHNAVDKLIGKCLQKGQIPLRNHILMLSGRIGFELVQKAMMAGIPILAAVGAPSSLAIELAEENGMTLIGFLREGRFNVYCGEERIN